MMHRVFTPWELIAYMQRRTLLCRAKFYTQERGFYGPRRARDLPALVDHTQVIVPIPKWEPLRIPRTIDQRLRDEDLAQEDAVCRLVWAYRVSAALGNEIHRVREQLHIARTAAYRLARGKHVDHLMSISGNRMHKR